MIDLLKERSATLDALDRPHYRKYDTRGIITAEALVCFGMDSVLENPAAEGRVKCVKE